MGAVALGAAASGVDGAVAAGVAAPAARRARHHEELRRGLDLSVLEDLEVGLSEVADHRALGVEDHGVELDDFGARAGHDRLGRLGRSGGGHDGEEEREGDGQ